jgi:hypothetical protein
MRGDLLADDERDDLGADGLQGLRRRAMLREERDEDPSYYDGDGTYPESVARLGEIGVLRDQRYVEVHIAPVRYDRGARGLRVARSIELRVAFDGDRWVRSAPATDRVYETVYRRSFLNYGQGRTFRLEPGSGDAIDAAPSESAAPLAGPIYKIKIRQNGVVRLDHARMLPTGFLASALSTWKLSSRGVEVPLQVRDVNTNGTMDPGDWVQFYGQALDDEPKAVLNTDIPGSDLDVFEASDFTDENVYFLTVETGTRSRMATRPSAATFTRTPPADFGAVAHAEVNDAWRPLGGADPWYWASTLSSPGTASRTDSVPLPGLASGTAPAQVTVRVRGTTEFSTVFPDHDTRVTLMNASSQVLATNDDNGTFDGRTIYTHDAPWTFPGSGAVLTDPAQVKLDLFTVPSITHSVILDWIEIRYRRTFQASGDALTFEYPDGDAEFIVSGLATSAPEAYEITGKVGTSGIAAPVRLTGGTVTGAGPFSIRFRVDNDPTIPNGTPRRFVVSGDAAATIPTDPDFFADTVSDLRNTATQADLIVVAHPAVLDSGPTAPLAQLLAFRASRGISSKVVLIGDVEDEFHDGLPGPLAIESFLTWVLSTNPGEGWASPKPAFVLLLGDGSYDYKAGTTNGNFVPTQILYQDQPELGYYASDNVLAAVQGADSMPELAVGRLPARTVAEANAMLQKVLDYEQSPPAGSWRRHAVLVADRGKNYDPNEAADFEATNDAAASYLKTPPHTVRKMRYWSDAAYCNESQASCNPATIKADIKAAVNGTDGFSDGAAIFQFEGHGNFDIWSDDIIFSKTDTDTLTNGTKLPWVLAHDCLTGGFHTTLTRSMGEDWVKRAGGGGVATFSPSWLSFIYLGRAVTDVLWNDVFGPPKERTIAVPVMDSLAQLCGQGATEACQSYVLLGDPAMGLVFPSVAPPTNVDATGANLSVDLAWTASTTPGARYDVYRKSTVAPFYVKANPTPVIGTTYADTNLTNTVTYTYYVVALDAEGFESRWSNFNSDCDVDGPDCVEATPLNPNAPAAPTGVTVTDKEVGGTLLVSWNANGESDIASYTVHWGTAPGSYSSSVNTAKNTSTILTGLTNGVTYHVAVKASNTSGLTSAFSLEKTGKPTFVRGVKAPRFITDLRIGKSGTNALLTWTPVTTDIYGKATTIANYEVYRGTTPTFVPVVGNRIGTPTGASFTDTNALQTGNPDYYYLVRAIDTGGNVGGLGHQLPNGIDTMTMGKAISPPGAVTLSWPAVTTDFDGKPTQIVRYEVYATDHRFTRDDIRLGLVPLLVSVTSPTATVTPPASNQFYSVLVVDARGNLSSF